MKKCNCSTVTYDERAGCVVGRCISRNREIGDWLYASRASGTPWHPNMYPIEDEFTTTPYQERKDESTVGFKW